MTRLPSPFPGAPFPMTGLLHALPFIAAVGVAGLSVVLLAIAVVVLWWVWNLTMPQL